MREAVTVIGAEIITRSEDKWNRTLDGLPIWECKRRQGYNSDVVVRVCQWQQSSLHQLENEGSNPSAPVQGRLANTPNLMLHCS